MTPPKNIESSAKVLVFACIDPRYTATLEKHLIDEKELHGDYDLFALAGCELGCIKKSAWKRTFFEHVDLAVALHGISDIWCYSHLDCGAYKAFLELEKDNDPKVHTKELRKFKKICAKKYPDLKFRGYLMNLEGGIKLMVK